MLVFARYNVRSRCLFEIADEKILKVVTSHFPSLNNIRHHSSVTEPTNRVIFSGIQPTGIPHLGNYLGALQQWVRLQDSAPLSTSLFFSIVDLHAITMRQDREHLRRWKIETLAALLAVGLDPKRSTIYFQSDVPAHTELMWILSCRASMGYLSRMTQWKSKMVLLDSKSALDTDPKSRLKLGLFSYPVLQAADILVHGATHVPVGEDQLQHLEFARDCAESFNHTYGNNILRQPATILSPARRVMSLRDPSQKMSKSHDDPRSRILLGDSPDDIRMKVKQALTDSIPGISYDPVGRPGVSNLLEILSYLAEDGRSCQDIATGCDTLSLRAFKEFVADNIAQSLAAIRSEFLRLTQCRNLDSLRDSAIIGAEEARRNATTVIDRVREAIGL